ncbi:NACHT and ankyrin domain protein [Trichoderma aethiopicum]
MARLYGDTTPGCYVNAVIELAAGRIQLNDFFKQCLAHFGPLEQRAHHGPDDNPLSDFIGPLMWSGKRFGPMACAIKICETDPVIGSIHGNKLEPYFLTCASSHASMASLRSCSSAMTAADVSQVMSLPLFRQAMLFTSLNTGHPDLGVEIVEEQPLTAPPAGKWLLRDHVQSLMESDMEQDQIPLRVWAALVRRKWTPATVRLLFNAATGKDAADSLDLLDAIHETDTGFLTSEPWFKPTAFDLVLKSGTPEVLQRLWELYEVPETDRLEDDMLIVAAEAQKSGGLSMMGWLLDQGLDVNYRRVTESDEEVPYLGDPREAAERLYAFQQAPISRRKTALHAAAFLGNAELVKYLLSRGADVDAQDGLGQTARYIAERDGHEAVVEAIDDHVKGSP